MNKKELIYLVSISVFGIAGKINQKRKIKKAYAKGALDAVEEVNKMIQGILGTNEILDDSLHEEKVRAIEEFERKKFES